jgi:hypothetical protein
MVLASAGLAACASPGDAPFATDDSLAFAPGSTAPIEFTVSAPDGTTPVANATVRIYGIRDDGTVGPIANATGLTNAAGFLSLDLPAGDYCASVRVAPPEWLTLDHVAPDQPLTFTPIGQLYGAVVRGRRNYVPFSPGTYQDCYTSLHLRHRGAKTEETVALGPGVRLTTDVVAPDGSALTGANVYAVMPVSVPWYTPSNGVFGAFFSFMNTTASPTDVVVSPGVPFALEFQGEVEVMANGILRKLNLTASGKGTANADGTSTLEASPLMCVQSTVHVPAGEPNVDFLMANFGYHANLDLSSDRSVASVELKHTGTGLATVTFRTDLANGRHTSTLNFTCANGNCQTTSIQHSGGNPEWLFHTSRVLATGETKTTVVLGNIPAHTFLTFAAKSAGDGIPLSSKSDDASAFIPFPAPPAQCLPSAGNDDRWAIGVF